VCGDYKMHSKKCTFFEKKLAESIIKLRIQKVFSWTW
jgi:hypothetical protein